MGVPTFMNEWSRNDIIALVSLILTFLTFAVAVLAFPGIRKLFSAGEQDLVILTPKNKDEIPIRHGEEKPIVRPVSGRIVGFTRDDIEKLGLFVEILIKTDTWYLQGNTKVEIDGRWTLKEARFGGSTHIIRATLKDQLSHEHKSAEIEVTLV